MDPLSAAQFASATAQFYQQVAQKIGAYLHDNIGIIPRSAFDILSDDQTRLISYSNSFYSISDQVAFAGADPYYKSITNATGSINAALNNIKTVNQIISISVGVIGLAAGVLSQNVGTIASSLASIAQAIKPAAAPSSASTPSLGGATGTSGV